MNKSATFSGMFPLGAKTMPRACMICGLSGATHVVPSGQAVHLACGKKKWEKDLERAKKKGQA